MVSVGTIVKVFIGLLLFMMIGAWIWKRYMISKEFSLREKSYMDTNMMDNIERERKAQKEYEKSIRDSRYGFVNNAASGVTNLASKVVDLVPSLLAEEDTKVKGGRNLATINI